MIYFGVQLFNHAFHIACVSKGFVPLDHLYLKFNRYQKLNLWKDSFSLSFEESCWFFDEFEFNKSKNMANFFENYKYCHNIYLVKHRKLVDMNHFLKDWEMFRFKNKIQKYGNRLEIPFLLALSFKIFHQDDIITFASSDDLPF